jgi:hypothetical protein
MSDADSQRLLQDCLAARDFQCERAEQIPQLRHPRPELAKAVQKGVFLTQNRSPTESANLIRPTRVMVTYMFDGGAGQPSRQVSSCYDLRTQPEVLDHLRLIESRVASTPKRIAAHD